MSIKAYIVDDHEDVRFALKYRMRRRLPWVTLVGESSTAEDALAKIPGLDPDIVVTDITLPGMDGIEFVGELRKACTDAYIVVMTGHEIDLYRDRALAAGANEIASKENIKGIVELLGRALPAAPESAEKERTGGS